MNDQERRDWVQNDEGLYQWWTSTGMSLARFIQRHRDEIDQVTKNVTTGVRKAHYLEYER